MYRVEKERMRWNVTFVCLNIFQEFQILFMKKFLFFFISFYLFNEHIRKSSLRLISNCTLVLLSRNFHFSTKFWFFSSVANNNFISSDIKFVYRKFLSAIWEFSEFVSVSLTKIIKFVKRIKRFFFLSPVLVKRGGKILI